MSRRSSPGLALGFAFCALAAPAQALLRTVTNTNDSGAGSLRAAIAAATAGDTIDFTIDGAGVQTIALLSALPPIAAGVTIDGTTQPDATTCAVVGPPTLLIEIAGDATPADTDGLRVQGDDVLVRGLVIHSFPGDGIAVANASGVRIECNFIGTDASGTQDFGNLGAGVRVVASTSSVIGDGNLISANAVAGVWIDETSSNLIVGANRIGTDAAGAASLANLDGVVVRGAHVQVAGNLISGNADSGIVFDAATATQNAVLANRIGSNALDTAPLPNGGSGVLLSSGASQNLIGRPPQAGNRFRGNGGSGVSVVGDTTLENSIRGNSMGLNGGLGLELGDPIANPNDPNDPDSGPNRLQNTPELADVSYAAGLDQVTASFSVATAPANATYPLGVDFYVADADGEEGEIYLGSVDYDATDFATGVVTKSFTPIGVVTVGSDVVATATDAAGNTSEFTATATTVVPEPGAFACGLAALAVIAMRRRRS